MIGHQPYHLHRVKFSELSEFYAAESIKAFAYGLVGIFTPIYLLESGVSFHVFCLLLFGQNIIRCMLEYFVGKGIARYGAKHILALSYPTSFIYLFLLAIYPKYQLSLVLIASVWALSDSLHWVAYQSVFSKVKSRKSSGRQISTMGILGIMVGSLGPIVGGYLAVKEGLQVVFVIAAIILILAMIPLYQSPEIIRSKKMKFKGLLSVIKSDMAAHAAFSFDVVVGTIIWPLFIYFVVKDYLKLGAIVSFSFLLSIVALVLVGKASDIMNKKRLVSVGSLGMTLVNIFRNMAASFWYVFGVNIAATILGPLLSAPLFSIFYTHADSTRRIEYTVLMEVAGDASRALMWGLIFLLTIFMSQAATFRAAFIMAGITLLATNIVKLNLGQKRH